MCISSTRRNLQSSAGIDSSLLQRVAVKTEYNPQQAPPSLDMSAFEPKPMVEKKERNAHIIVQHNYHDHANDSRADYQEEHPARGGVTTPFPLKLHEMLENVQADGYEHIVSWQPHGRCFVVHKPKEFVQLLPNYFKLSKLASFQRQLNLYGFQRLTRGRDRGGYYHELFLRGRVFLAHSIQRIKVKGTGVRARSNPDQEPDFWGMQWVDQHTGTSRISAAHMIAQQAPPKIQLPLPTTISSLQQQIRAPSRYLSNEEQDIVCAFGDKTFHYLDPFQSVQEKPRQPVQVSHWAGNGADELLSTEAESFFQDFEFPENIGAEIENDAVFGEMLESLIC